MRPKEDYTRHIVVAFGFTLAILVIFQVYIFREPARIQAVEAADKSVAEATGRDLFASNCTACHGQNGQGNVGPALNSQQLLKTTSDDTLFNLIRTGVPGSVMPAWGQIFGGPFTDEQVVQLVAFIRAWEPTAPSVVPTPTTADPARGAATFASTCFICHGENGQGTERAPALNDPARLQQFDDVWYRDTIAQGRPAKGMPTWGTVLSPGQIDDLVALLAAWRAGQVVTPTISVDARLSSALFALERSDPIDASFQLNAALAQASGAQATDIEAILALIQKNDLAGAQERLNALMGSVEEGAKLFEANCAPCHGADGTGKVGPNLHTNAFILSKSNSDLIAFILAGRPGTAMAGFQGRLSEEQLRHIAALLRSWQK